MTSKNQLKKNVIKVIEKIIPNFLVDKTQSSEDLKTLLKESLQGYDDYLQLKEDKTYIDVSLVTLQSI